MFISARKEFVRSTIAGTSWSSAQDSTAVGLAETADVADSPWAPTREEACPVEYHRKDLDEFALESDQQPGPI
jgi:hypothetical protein